MQIIYEDNHLIAVNKISGEIVQRDKTGDDSLIDEIKEYLKEKYNKKGNVFLGSPHRLDRPTSGIVLFSKTSKALERLNEMFASNKIYKNYLAITDAKLEKDEGELVDYLLRNEAENKTYVCSKETKCAKIARLSYKYLSSSLTYHLYSIILYTGRHHQIRAQLQNENVHIRGDVKYGFKRANTDKSISLHSYKMIFTHPVSRNRIELVATPNLNDSLWKYFYEQIITNN